MSVTIDKALGQSDNFRSCHSSPLRWLFASTARWVLMWGDCYERYDDTEDEAAASGMAQRCL